FHHRGHRGHRGLGVISEPYFSLQRRTDNLQNNRFSRHRTMRKIGKTTILLLITFVCTLLSAACVCGPEEGAVTDRKKTGSIRIGLSLDTLKEERWQRDRDLFVARARELGAEVLVQSANSDDKVQNQQVENLLTQGIDVLVIVPHNAEVAGAAV